MFKHLLNLKYVTLKLRIMENLVKSKYQNDEFFLRMAVGRLNKMISIKPSTHLYELGFNILYDTYSDYELDMILKLKILEEELKLITESTDIGLVRDRILRYARTNEGNDYSLEYSTKYKYKNGEYYYVSSKLLL